MDEMERESNAVVEDWEAARARAQARRWAASIANTSGQKPP
jgi:hypothetical protein